MSPKNVPARAEHSAPSSARRGRLGSLALLVLFTAGGVYAGARWHLKLERWFAASEDRDGSAVASGEGSREAKDGVRQLWTCGMHPQVIQDHPGDCPLCHMKLTPLVTSDGSTGSAGGAGAPGAVVIDPSVVQNMGVRMAVVVEGPLAQHVRAMASVVEPESGRRDIALRVSGWIQTLHANTDGMAVRKGDPMFDLYSPDLQLAIEELIAARKSAPAARQGPGREGDDLGATLVSAAELRLAALGLTAEQIAAFGGMEHAPPVVTFQSPMNGVVIEKAGVNAGSAVAAGQVVLRLGDRSTMWLEARVPERVLGRLRVGQKATVRVDDLGVEGEVVFVHPRLDEMTRTGLARIAVPNPEGLLRQGMYAIVEIDAGSAEPVTLIPREAVIDTGQTRLVFVSAGPGRFEPRSVSVGRAGDQGLVEVVSGLEPGESVVTSGQFLLDSESRLREAVAKFLGQREASGAASGERVRRGSIPLSTVAQGRVDAVVEAYLVLVEGLGAVQESDHPLAPEALISAVRALQGEVSGAEAIRLVSEATSAAQGLKGHPLDHQREAFKGVSASVIALVDAMPPSSRVSANLWVLHCPMAKADWLQRSKEVANPYYAQDMKECGSVVRPADGSKGAE